MRIPINLAAIEESKPVANAKYNLTITDVEEGKSGEKSKKPGTPQLIVSIGIDGHENSPNVRHYISLINEDDEARAANYKALLLKRFLVLFRIPFDEVDFDLEAFRLATAFAELQLEDAGDC